MISQLRLRSIDTDSDIDFLYKSMTAPDQYLFSSTLSLNSIDDFRDWFRARLRNDFHDLKMICYNDDPAGFVYSYDFSLLNGHCKLCTYVSDNFRNSGIGGMGTIIFIGQLFDDYPLRKIYTTVYDYNKQSLESNLQSGFCEEGIIKEFKYYNGSFYDMHYFSLSREAFEKKMKFFIDGDQDGSILVQKDRFS